MKQFSSLFITSLANTNSKYNLIILQKFVIDFILLSLYYFVYHFLYFIYINFIYDKKRIF